MDALKITVPYVPSDEESRAGAEKLANSLYGYIMNGADFAETAKLALPTGNVGLTEQSLDMRSAHQDPAVSPAMFRAAWELWDGGVSPVFEENGSAFAIIKCVSRTEGPAEPYESVKEVIKRELASEQYDEMIAMMTGSATVVKSRVYGRLDAKNMFP